MAHWGHLYQRLTEAVRQGGSARSVYSPDTTLSRRGLLTRADKRARELASVGVGSGSVVVLAMGNVAEFVVLLLALSKLRAVAMPFDPQGGDRALAAVAARLPIRAVIRRPCGDGDGDHPDYGAHAQVVSRRRLSGSRLTLEVLDSDLDPTIPDDAELVHEVRRPGGAVHDIFRDATQLRAVGDAAADALRLQSGVRILCTEPVVLPRFFDTVVLGWFASESQLSLGEAPTSPRDIPQQGFERLLVFDTVGQLLGLARRTSATATAPTFTPAIGQATVPSEFAAAMRKAFGSAPLQLLQLEEAGLLAARTLERGSGFRALPGVELTAGEPMEVGGQELLFRSAQPGTIRPSPGPGHPAAAVQSSPQGWRHTGFAVRFNRRGEVLNVIGRDDGLLDLEGRRACLDSIEDEMLAHRRLTWVRTLPAYTDDGEPYVRLQYVATGQTEVDDIEEHAIGALPPFMVPRAFERLEQPDD